MSPPLRHGIKTVNRRLPDGTTRTYLYDRATGDSLGNDWDAAVALRDERHQSKPEFAAGLVEPITRGAQQDRRLAAGEAGELLVMAELAMGGLILLKPSHHTPYDFAVDDGASLWRVQVKTKKELLDSRKRQVVFQLGRQINGRRLPSYADRGVDMIAFVYWPWRAIMIRRASEYHAKQYVTFPIGTFRDLPPLLDRWSKMTAAMRPTHNSEELR